jgi:hypothetical protein
MARLADLVWRPVAILLASRLTAWVVLYLAQPLTHTPSPFTYHIRRWWDTGWYIRAAEYGWPHYLPKGPSTLAFLPALPVLIRIVHGVTPLGWSWSALVVAFITQIAMAIAVWHLTSDIWGTRVANRATILLCFAPGAVVFSLVYSDPLLIAAAATCMLCLRKHLWVLAGLAAAVGTATSPNAFPIIACCAWEAFFAIRRRRDWWSLSAVILAASGVGSWFSYLWATTGSALAWSTNARTGWRDRADLLAFLRLVQKVERSGSHDPGAVIAIGGATVALILLVLLICSKPPAMLLVFASLVVAISFFTDPTGLLPRFVMDAFPLSMGLAYMSKGESFGVVVGVSAMLMSVLLVVEASTLALLP